MCVFIWVICICFTILNFDRLISYSAQSLAFSLHVEQILFALDVAKCGWEVVLHKEPIGVWLFSKHQRMDEVQCISLGRTSNFCGLKAMGLYDDLTSKTPIFGNVIEVEPKVVAKALEHLEGQNDTWVDDLEYCNSDRD